MRRRSDQPIAKVQHADGLLQDVMSHYQTVAHTHAHRENLGFATVDNRTAVCSARESASVALTALHDRLLCFAARLSVPPPLSAQVVHSLRHRHANLLRPRGEPPTNAAAAAANREESVHGKSSTAAPRSHAAMPIRLVTNGFWPMVAGQVLGSCCPTVDVSGSTGTPAVTSAASAARFQGRGRREGNTSGGDEGEGDSAAQAQPAQMISQSSPGSGPFSERGGSNPEVGVNATSVASEIAGLFDSVSVALNTADPLQYDEVGGCPWNSRGYGTLL